MLSVLSLSIGISSNEMEWGNSHSFLWIKFYLGQSGSGVVRLLVYLIHFVDMGLSPGLTPHSSLFLFFPPLLYFALFINLGEGILVTYSVTGILRGRFGFDVGYVT